VSLTPEEFGTAFRRFIQVMNTAAATGGLAQRLSGHLGQDPATVPVLAEEFPSYEHPCLQLALDAVLAADGIEFERVGLAAHNKRYLNPSLSDMLAGDVREGPVDWTNVHLGDGTVLPCVRSGLFLITEHERPAAVFVSGAQAERPDSSLQVEVIAAEPGDAERLLARIRELMEQHNVYRGHVLSLRTGHMFGPRGPTTDLVFHERPTVAREDVVLPDGIMDRVERHTVVFSEHAQALRDAGQGLRRGILLHGPPGVGKTLTVRYLCSRLAGRTVLLLTGNTLGALTAVSTLARQLAPSMVVVEDVDLIAEERTTPFRSASSGFLFELLNEMDGLRDDADVIYVLTTNRADLLEPALALRPGRVDLTVHLPLPDADGRRRLLALYSRGVEADLDWEPYVGRTEGASPAYIKELLRQAVLSAAQAGRGNRITAADLDDAIAGLASGGELAQRLLGAAGSGEQPAGRPPFPPGAFPRGGGFPASPGVIVMDPS